MHKQYRIALAGLLAALTTLSVPVNAAQTIPTSRTFGSAWQNAGYQGAIPAPDTIVNVRDFGAVGDGVANDRAAILAAIAALGGAPGVVFFPAGTYYMTAQLSVPGGVVLRGERPHNTTLKFNYIYHCIAIAKNESGAFQAITSGYTIHSSTIVVADGGEFEAGDYAETREENDPGWGASTWAPYVVGQIVRITNVAGNTLTLERPLRITYQAVQNPEIRKITPIQNAGVENLSIERVLAGTDTQRNNQFTVQFKYTANCWIRGVESRMGFGGHVGIQYGTKVDVTGCYFNDAHEHDGGGSGYGTRLEFKTGECLMENNVYRHLRHSMLVQAGVNGNVFGYNYSREQDRTELGNNFASDITCHGNYVYANLFEGNVCQYMNPDNSHGDNGPLNTFFRNRGESFGFRITDSGCDDQNIVGNEAFDGLIDYGLIKIPVDGYDLAGTGHFEYGNNVEDDGIVPAGTGGLTDYSYYLNDDPSSPPPAPDSWNIADAIPTIGPPHAHAPAKNNPAYVRYFGAGAKTVGPPSIEQQPTNRVVDQGQPASFTVVAHGTPTPTYAWDRDGTPIAGATNAALSIANAQPANAGAYRVTVSDDGGSMTSVVATLTVNVTEVSFTVNGNPAAYGVPAPFGYTTTNLQYGTIVTNTVATPVAAAPGVRHRCTGWSGTGSVPGSGHTNRADVTATTNSVLTWNWTTQYFLDLELTGNGSLDRSDQWVDTGGSVTVNATAGEGYLFDGWQGDVPPGNSTTNPLTLAMTQPRVVNARFGREPPTGTLVLSR